jgi:hypothetical protein
VHLRFANSDDEEEVQGNPLVAGYQEDLGSDEEEVVKKSVESNNVRQVELSSDEDISGTDFTLPTKGPVARSSPSTNDSVAAVASPIYAKSNTNGSVSPLAASLTDFNSNRTSVRPDVHSATADSSDEMEDSGQVVVLKDEDISDTEPADQVDVIHFA